MPADLDLTRYSDEDLLRLWNRISVVLRQRGVCRTKNIVSDVAERMVAQRLGLTLAPNSTRGHDATALSGERYQIKARLWRRGIVPRSWAIFTAYTTASRLTS